MELKVNEMLKNLEGLLKTDKLTVAQKVEHATFVCFTEKVGNGGVLYHQGPFEKLQLHMKQAFFNKKKGEMVENRYKVIAIYDVWE